MTAFLKLIELENFKSYGGKLTIGPLKSFTAVIGPNGSGKSNFMDAISFVMGEKISSLRAKRLTDLIHGSSIGKPVAVRAHVTAIFVLEDGTEKSFTRTVEGSTSEYRINGDLVPHRAYVVDLEEIGINVKAKNFLVFQGAVESIATKKPQDLTSLFEEISGSVTFKTEYERLQIEMLQAEEEIQCTYQKKKGMAAEKKEATNEIKEAEKYQRLKDKYMEKRVEIQLFHLFHNEKNVENLQNEQGVIEEKFEEVETKRRNAEEILKERRKESGKLAREFAKIEQDLREAEVTIGKKKPTFIKAKERVSFMRNKLDSAQKSLIEARSAQETHNNDIQELMEELRKVEEMMFAYENTIIGSQSQSQTTDVELEDKQILEYNRLREEASKKSAAYDQLLDSVNREVKSDHDRLENQVRKKTEIENRLKQKRQMRSEVLKRMTKLEEHVKSMETSLEEQSKMQNDLRSDVGTSKEKIHELETELETIIEKLGDANVDNHELARAKRKAEIVENLKRLFIGVYDRMYNMCEPIHKRYNVAVTKVLGMYMDAIVVDTVITARQCVKYLKEQYLEAETFLPLDYIQPRPLKERLRNIQEPKNVKLVYDVLKFAPKEINRAVFFATRNFLVCETPEDACKVAYDMDKQTRNDCIALDGTCYQKAGLISGGSLDLVRRARRWDDKQITRLKSQKEKMTEELRELLMKSRKESDLNTIESQIRGLETRLKYSKSDLAETKKEILFLDAEIDGLQAQLEKFGPIIREIETTIAERERDIDGIKEKINNVEDEVYGNFCQQIGVSNIRRYEERELQLHQERAKKRLEFDNQCNRIQNQIEFEKLRDTQSNVLRWEQHVLDAEKNLKIASQAETDMKMEIDKDAMRMEELETMKNAKKKEIDQKEVSVARWRREVGTFTKKIQNFEKQISAIEIKIEGLIAERHTILVQCKMDDIAIPMNHGNLEDVAEQTSVMDDKSLEMQEREDAIAINYRTLSNNMKKVEAEDFGITIANLNKGISDLQTALENIHAPNMRAMQKLAQVKEKSQETNEAFEISRKKAKKIKTQFERVKKERYDMFMPCFEHVAKQIDPIYKGLTKNQSAQAILEPENPEEPYLDGINYNCVAPGKRFRLLSHLSGGEKTVAALALLFAIHSFHPAPFFVLDEVDACLDNTNIGKVANYIRDKMDSLQTIVISLKNEFYSEADALIGVCPEPGECLQSSILTADLTIYDKA